MEFPNTVPYSTSRYRYVFFMSSTHVIILQQKAHVDEIDARSQPIKEAAAKELEVLQRSRTTENTTLEEVMRRYPHVYKTVMDKIEDENYDTRYPAIDQDGAFYVGFLCGVCARIILSRPSASPITSFYPHCG